MKVKFRLISIMTVLLIALMMETVFAAKDIINRGQHYDANSAMQIIANHETYADGDSGNPATFQKNMIRVTGYVDNKNSDWYKVTLQEGKNYLTKMSGAFVCDIKDKNGKSILSDGVNLRFEDNGDAFQAYEFDVPQAGDYYVVISGFSGAMKEYTFLIGSPVYLSENVELKGERIHVSSGEKWKIPMKAVAKNIPEDAFVAEIVNENGVGIADVDIMNLKSNLNVRISSYESAARNMLSMKMFAKSEWRVTYTGKKRDGKTFTPMLDVRYIYPLKNGFAIK
ncbi:hypothetical protein SAMN05216584_1202 [Selenomonas sp. WCT3]|uniref:hypothetical protein n=1 Tax=Selenomonas sp. WCT3 TaxID=3158785 RepID=UPI00087E9857|nr:hypothetical protein SAMN05216584_1202 [Selenomonas ruminantium]